MKTFSPFLLLVAALHFNACAPSGDAAAVLDTDAGVDDKACRVYWRAKFIHSVWHWYGTTERPEYRSGQESCSTWWSFRQRMVNAGWTFYSTETVE